MKIKSLSIKGYKNLNINLRHETDIMAIIGNNGSGKSNLLEALCFIFRSLYNDKYSLDFDYCITFENTDKKVIQIKKENAKRPIFTVDNDDQISITEYLPKRIVIIYSGEEDRLWRNCIDPFYQDYIREINKTATHGIPSKPDSLPQILYINKYYWHVSLLGLICSDLIDNKLFIKEIMKIDKVDKIKFYFKRDNYKNYASSNTLEFIKSIDKKSEYTLDTFKKTINEKGYISDDVFKYLYVAYTPRDTKILENIIIKFNGQLTVEDLSEGEKKLLLIKAALEFAGQEDTLFVLDEPDAHVHVTNKEEITKAFEPYKNNRQIIFTTHSPTLVNCLEDECLYMINNGEFISKRKQDKLNYLIGDSWSKHQMGALLSSRKKLILFVEGKHDKTHIINAFAKLKDDYKGIDFDVFSIGGESKIRPLMTGLYEAQEFEDKTYIAIFDNDSAGVKAFNDGFDKEENNLGYKKLHKDQHEHDNFFAFLLPKTIGFEKDFTIEALFEATKYEDAYKDALSKTLGHFSKNSIEDINKDIKDKSKNILAENSKDFSKEDFNNFKPIFDLLVKIKNRSLPLMPIPNAENIKLKEEKSSIKTSTQPTIFKPIEEYTEGMHFKDKSEEIINLYTKYKDAILKLSSNIEIKPQKWYIAFKNGGNISDIEIQKRNIKISINLKKGQLVDPKGLMIDVSNKGHSLNGDYEVKVSDEKNFDYIISLIKQTLKTK